MKYLMKILFRGLVISAVVATIMISLEIAFGRTLTIDSNFAIELGYYCIYCIILTAINSVYFDYVNRKVSWRKFGRYRIPISAIGGVALTILGIFLIRILINVLIEGQSFTSFLKGERVQFYIISLLITLVMTLFFHAVYFYKRTQENKVKEQKIIAGTASAKFETLKNQIDPHFLFNSLNVLSSLIEENPDSAQKFTASLSKIYRYVLEQKDKELVSVEEELSFARTYMNLLKMRFENSVFFEMPETVPAEAWVVPLSLQLLLENTVKHNVVSEQKPLYIKIYVDGDVLVVENKLQKKEVLQSRQGVGLQNIVNRYAIITNRKVMLEETADAFVVKIPILTKQVAVLAPIYIDERNAYQRAQKKMEDIRDFYGHATSYVLVIVGLVILNVVTTPGYWWVFWPAIGWGIGLGIHGVAVYSLVPFLGKDWEERKIQKIIEEEKIKKWE